MKKSIFKPILAGILLGAAIFMFGLFLLRALVFFLIVGAIARFFIVRRFRRNFSRYSKFNTEAFNRMQAVHTYDARKQNIINLRNREDINIINID
ncbi:MAG: hypothetical protein ABI921_11365 [Panacibacter sp.]